MQMRLSSYAIVFSLLCLVENVIPLILTSTLMTGFMGGYLIGKMPLQTFVNFLASNRTTTPAALLASVFPVPVTRDEQKSQQYAPTQVQAQSTYKHPGTEISDIKFQPINVPVSLDNKIRDRFIRQLALMDPLNCLPKIFCEVSADPFGTAAVIDHGTITGVGPFQQPSITKEELLAYENSLKNASTIQKPVATVNDETDKNESDSDESSESEADDSEQDDEDSFEKFRKKETHKLEMQALEEMVDDIDDPMTYMYILRDKKKRKASRNKNKKKHQERLIPNFQRPIPMAYSNPHQMYLNRRMGSEPPPPLPPPVFMPPKFPTAETSIDDMFADDPFFSDFTGPSQRSGRSASDAIQIALGSRSNENAFISGKEDDLMKKYKVAFLIAEKYRSPNMCNAAFPTCPFQAKTIISVVNRLESGLLPFGKESNKIRNKPDSINIEQFKNTLLAIERLNKVTLHAKKHGQPINIEKMTEFVTSPTSQIDANTSKQIIKEFQDVVARINTSRVKRKKHNRRRHGTHNQKRKYDMFHYIKKAQIGVKTKQGTKTLTVKTKISTDDDDLNPAHTPTFNQTYKDMFITQGSIEALETVTRTKTSNYDDESNPQRPHTPTFNQTYKEMFKISRVKPKPRPTTKRPRPYQNIIGTKYTRKPSTSTSTTTTKPIKKFQPMAEDDERDAKDTEDAVDDFISQPKPDRSPIL